MFFLSISGHSVHLAYIVHKSGCEASTIQTS